jgi:hypothetical protein
MGLLYERAAVEFWTSVADNGAGPDRATEPTMSEAEGTH